MGWALQQRNGGKTMKGSKEKQPAAMFTRELEVQLCSQIQVSSLFTSTAPRPMLLRALRVNVAPIALAASCLRSIPAWHM